MPKRRRKKRKSILVRYERSVFESLKRRLMWLIKARQTRDQRRSGGHGGR